MKKLFSLILLIIIFSCKDNSREIENLELMSYYYIPNDSIKKYGFNVLAYAFVDENGNVLMMKKVNPNPISKNYTFTSKKIDIELLKKIAEDNFDRNEEYYNNTKRVYDKIDPDIYDGPLKRIRLKFKNGKNFSFVYSSENKKNISEFVNIFKEFVNIFKELENKPDTKLSVETERIVKDKQLAYQTFTMKKDTSMLPFPPFPKFKTDIIKFIKKK